MSELLRIEGLSAGYGEAVVLHDVSLALGEGQTVHPAVPASGLIASYTGDVTIDQPGRYRFAAQMQGGVAKLSVAKAGASVGQGAMTADQSMVRTGWIELPSGSVSLSVSYTRNGSGPARLRTMWEKEGAGVFNINDVRGYIT